MQENQSASPLLAVLEMAVASAVSAEFYV